MALIDSVLLILLGLRYFFLLSLSMVVVLMVVEIVVLPLSLYLGLGTEFVEERMSFVLDLDVGGVNLLDPLLRDLLKSLLLNVEVSTRGASTCSTDSSSVTRLAGLVLDRTRPRNGLDGRVEFRDVILTLDLFDGPLVVVVVVVSDELNLRLVKPNGRGCETVAIVDLLAVAVVVFVVVVDEVVAGNVVNKISVAEFSTSFIESVVELVLSILGLTLDGFSGGSTLITVMTSVEVEVVVVGVVDEKVVVLSVVLDCTSGYSFSFAGGVVISNEDTLDKFCELFEAMPLNLCMLVYLKDFKSNVNRIMMQKVR